MISDIRIYNPDRELVYVLDIFESLIWTDRFYEPGDFELTIPLPSSSIAYINPDNYISISGSKRWQIMEKLRIKTDLELGNKLIVSGRCLLSIMDRRHAGGIIFGAPGSTIKLNTIYKTLVEFGYDSPISYPERYAGGYIHYEDSTDPDVLAVNTGKEDLELRPEDNFLDTIVWLANEFKLGLKFEVTADREFMGIPYVGVDRSYSQSTNPYVIFSPEFETLKTSDYLVNTTPLKTKLKVVGAEAEGNTLYETVEPVVKTGLDLREGHVDATDISRYDALSALLPSIEYRKLLNTRGTYVLYTEHQPIEEFVGEADTRLMYELGTDFDIGDIVQFENEYGLGGAVRVVEVTHSVNQEGSFVFPTFESI